LANSITQQITCQPKSIDMYKLLLIFFLTVISLSASAIGGTVIKDTIKKAHVKKAFTLKLDSTKVTQRAFNAAALDKYHKDPQFNYESDLSKNDSMWTRFWRWFWELIERLFGGRESSSTGSTPAFIKYILITIIVVALVYGIIKFAGVDKILNRDSQKIEIPYSESLANIHEITFDDEIEKAISQRNYKLGVRLLYLRSLKQLSDAGLIQWKIEKTNSAYLNEISNNDQRSSFSVLTRQFEYIWYGDFPVDGPSFQNLNTLFTDFKKMLS